MDKEIMRAMRKAVKTGDLDRVKEMLEQHKGLVDEASGFGTWLQVAAKHGQLPLVEYFIEIGFDVNQIGGLSKCGPIRDAANGGHLDIVKYLHKHGAVFDIRSFNKNPLFTAIVNGHVEIAKFFIDNGIDITVGYPIGKFEHMDAYEYARQYGQKEIQNYLKEILIKTDYFESKRKEHNPLVNR